MNTHTCNLTDKSIPLQTNPYPPLPSSLITRGDDNWPGPRISTERGRGGEREGGREGERGRERERGGGGGEGERGRGGGGRGRGQGRSRDVYGGRGCKNMDPYMKRVTLALAPALLHMCDVHVAAWTIIILRCMMYIICYTHVVACLIAIVRLEKVWSCMHPWSVRIWPL